MSVSNPRPPAVRFILKLIQILLYIPIQIAFMPLVIVGLAIAVPVEMGRTRKDGISFSAVKALQYRWIAHNFSLRPDPLSVAFTRKFPYETHLGMWLVLGAQIIAKHLLGFTPKGVQIVPAEETSESTAVMRVLMFDRILEKYADRVEQIVLPGAGFDLIALHYTDKEKHAVFELDQVNTLRAKTETLWRARIPHEWIHYVPVDYAKESWADKLVASGFDSTKKTLFLWQSVSLYLNPELVEKTLVDMAMLCTEGSVIAQDFYSKAFITGETSKAAKSFFKLIERMGEPARFGLEMSENPRSVVRSFLQECGLKMTQYVQFGESRDIEPFYCIVEAEKA